MSHLVTKISILMLVLLGNTSLLSMKCNKKLILNKSSHNQNQNKDNTPVSLSDFDEISDSTHLPLEVIEGVGACACDSTKQALKQTCKYLDAVISPNNINFVSHPLFKTSEQRIHRMAIRNNWYNNTPMVNVLRKHLRDDKIIISNFTTCDRFGEHVNTLDKDIFVDLPMSLNKLFNDANPLKGQMFLDLAIHCAALSDDTATIKNLAPQIMSCYKGVHGYGRNEVQKSLMMLLAKRGNKEAFEFMVNEDPYRIREYHNAGRQHYYENTLLDDLNRLKGMEDYVDICKKHGEKTSKEATPNNCVIS